MDGDIVYMNDENAFQRILTIFTFTPLTVDVDVDIDVVDVDVVDVGTALFPIQR